MYRFCSCGVPLAWWNCCCSVASVLRRWSSWRSACLLYGMLRCCGRVCGRHVAMTSWRSGECCAPRSIQSSVRLIPAAPCLANKSACSLLLDHVPFVVCGLARIGKIHVLFPDRVEASAVLVQPDSGCCWEPSSLVYNLLRRCCRNVVVSDVKVGPH